MSDALQVALFLAVPISIPVVGIWLLNWRARRRPAGSGRFYVISVAGSKVVVSGHALAKLLLILIPFTLLHSLFLLFIPFFLLGVAGLFIFGAKRTSSAASSQATQSLLEGLRSTTRQLEAARSHIEALAADAQARQVAIEESEKVRESLTREIESRLREVDAWRTLTEEQKAAFVGAAREAINKTSTIRIATVAAWSVLLNIVASAAWSLMGAPGQAELQALFSRFQTLLGL